jgi:hypothetical protein
VMYSLHPKQVMHVSRKHNQMPRKWADRRQQGPTKGFPAFLCCVMFGDDPVLCLVMTLNTRCKLQVQQHAMPSLEERLK